MSLANVPLFAFNRGVISKLGLARVDLANNRTALSGEIQENFMPRTLGSMMLRPGFKHLGTTLSDKKAYFVSFIFATADTAKLELTDLNMRIWVNDSLVSRVAVSSAVTNGNFDTNLTGWTDNDQAGGVSDWVVGGYMGLTGNGTAAAIRDQQVTVSGADQNKEHALRIVIQRGPVLLRVGSTLGDDDYIAEAVLRTGTHSLAFTPTGNFHIRFLSRLKRQVLVDSCNVEGAGVVSIPTPWVEADLRSIRYDQSADVIYVAANTYRQRRIERRGTTSWSVVQYLTEDGPFRAENTGPITMTAGALSGNTTLTASAAYFKSTNVGSLFRVTASGQRVTAAVTAENQFTGTIRVTGTGTQRAFTVIRSGTWSATVTLQRSLVDSTGPFEDVTTYTNNGTVNFNDGLDNQIVFYRIGVKTGDFTSGTANLELKYSVGSTDGICRVTGFTSSTVVSVEVIKDFGDTVATNLWAEGSWSDRRGFPSAVGFVEGRLGWHGKNGIFLSVTDAYESFDSDVEGDSGPLNRTIGQGPVDVIHWALALQRLVLGGQGAEISVRSSSFGEPITPSEFNPKQASTQGSANVAAIKLDSAGIFVQSSETRIFEMLFDSEVDDYQPRDLTLLAPEIGEPTVIRLAIQRQPDTRIHAIRSDGKAAVLLRDAGENILCWVTVKTDGKVEDVLVLPGTKEDQVYYVVNRTIGGVTKRFFEKWSMESDAIGGTQIYSGVSTTTISDLPFADGRVVTVRDINKAKIQNATVTSNAITLSSAVTYAEITPATYTLADSFVKYSGVAASVITGLSHLNGKTVVCFADGKDRGTFTVSGGQITLSESVQEAVVGLGYDARFKSTKLAYASNLGTGLTQRKKVTDLGLIMNSVHAKGIRFGPSFNDLSNLPEVEDGKLVDADFVWPEYDQDMHEFFGEWNTDSRVHLVASAPKPCTVLAAIVGIEAHDNA